MSDMKVTLNKSLGSDFKDEGRSEHFLSKVRCQR